MLLAVARRDAGRLLAAVLQGVEPEVGELGDLLARGPDAEDAAGVLRALLPGEQIVGQSAVAASRHSLRVPGLSSASALHHSKNGMPPEER